MICEGNHWRRCLFFRSVFSRASFYALAKNAKGMAGMTEDDIGKQVVDIAVRIHKELGPGLHASAWRTERLIPWRSWRLGVLAREKTSFLGAHKFCGGARLKDK
jgi:hypothetical protein